MTRGHRLRTLGDLNETHHGRTVETGDLVGRLDGVIPLGPNVQLVLCIGGSRVFTDAMPATQHVEVHQKGQTP
jgi:hypothetical protein